MQKHNLNKAALQIYLNHTPTNPEKLTAYLWNTLQMGNTPGRLLLHVKIIKELINYKFLFAVVKRNLLTLKINK